MKAVKTIAIFAVLFLVAGATAQAQEPAQTPAQASSADPAASKNLNDLLPGLLFTREEKLSRKMPDAETGVFPSGRYHRTLYSEDALFRMYQDGEYNKILYNLLNLARQGNARAEETIGLMYRFGQGVKQDPQQAHRWFTRAAERQRPLAQHHLGALHFEGHSGIPRDMMKAATWLELAVTNYPEGPDRARAVSDLENVKLRLSRLEQAQATDLAKQYLRRFPADPETPRQRPADTPTDTPDTAPAADPAAPE